eukprot:34135-Pyramimonas_sp.AAC.1
MEGGAGRSWGSGKGRVGRLSWQQGMKRTDIKHLRGNACITTAWRIASRRPREAVDIADVLGPLGANISARWVPRASVPRWWIWINHCLAKERLAGSGARGR